jgi:hypothetical protein
MSEIETLHALEARMGLLGRSGSEQELLDNAAAFTRAAASELAKNDPNWGNVRKTSGVNVRGLDVDKILHKLTLQMFDIVIGAGAAGQHVGWQNVAKGRPDQWVEAESFPPPIVVPHPEPVVETLEDLRDLLDSLDTKTEALLDHAHAIHVILDRAAAKFGV